MGAGYLSTSNASASSPVFCNLGGEVDAGIFELKPCASLLSENDDPGAVAIVPMGVSWEQFDGGGLLTFCSSTCGCSGGSESKLVQIRVSAAALGGFVAAEADAGALNASASFSGSAGSGVINIEERDVLGAGWGISVGGRVDLIFKTDGGTRRLLAGFDAP